MVNPRGDSPHGQGVENGVVNHWSATSLTLGDPTTGDGCPRKWFYEKVLKLKPKETKAQHVGKDLHSENEIYLKTGTSSGMGSLAMRGKHMLPTPGDDLLVEADLLVPLSLEVEAREAERVGGPEAGDAVRARACLKDAPLKILGVPYVGFADLIHARGTNQGAVDPDDAVDPSNTVEVVDWKTTKDPRYIKSPMEVSQTVQMTSYGKWVLTQMPWVEHVRLSHGYYITTGTHLPRKISLRVLPEAIEVQWEHVERISRLLSDVARAREADLVEANQNACGAYGGCPHRSYCRAGTQSGLVKFFGVAGAKRIALTASNRSQGTMSESEIPKAGIAGLRLGAKTLPEPKVAATAQSNPSSAELASEMKRLAKEEAEIKYPKLLEQWKELKEVGLGTPMLSNNFARAIADLTGAELFGGILAGSSDLQNSGPFDDPSAMVGILEAARELESDRSKPKIEVVNGSTTAGPVIVASSGITAEAPKKRGRPPKARTEVTTSQTTMSQTTTPQVTTPQSPESSQILVFYENCYPSCYSTSFWPTVYRIMADMATEAGLKDIRQADSNHDLGFGRWKPALALALKLERLPLGHHTFETTGTEVSQIVVEAMREAVSGQGGVWVR